MTSGLTPIFTQIGISTLLFVQPPPPPSPSNVATPNLRPRPPPPPFPCFCCFNKPDPSPICNIYINLSLYPFNCTRNPLHRHLTKCRSYRLEKLGIQISLPRRCPDFLVFLVLITRDANLHHHSRI